MIKNDDKNEKYVLLDGEDIIKASKTLNKNDSLYKNLINFFSDFNSCDELGNYRLEKTSALFDYIKNVEGVIYLKEYITLQSLSLALSRAIYEYNHEMKKKLTKYLRALMDSIINNQEVETIKNIIASDDKLMNYIEKFDSLDDYIKSNIQKRIKVVNEPVLVVSEEITSKEKNKSHVIM